MAKEVVLKKLESIFEGLSEEEISALPLHKFAGFFVDEVYMLLEASRKRIDTLSNTNAHLTEFLERMKTLCSCGAPEGSHTQECIGFMAHQTEELIKKQS